METVSRTRWGPVWEARIQRSSPFTSQRFTRTLEGSACVLITGIVVLLMHAALLTTPQFVAGLLIIPIAMTLTEAYSPHAWDTPFLMLVGYGTLLGVMQL